MYSFGRQDLRRRLARCAHVGFALGLLAGTPFALGQKMYKCADGSGGVTFQQSPCPETPKEAEARMKEKERLQAEELRKKEEEARKKEEQALKVRERDKAYQEQMNERAQERRRSEEAERRLLEGSTRAADAADGSMPAGLEQLYPGPWREDAHAGITAALGKNKIKGCGQLKYRQRVGGGLGEYLVDCTPDGTNWVRYFVWPQTGAVRGPTSSWAK